MLGRLLETEVEDEEETEVLFTEAANASPFLSALTADDISCMASHLSVMSFDVDDIIMEKGETGVCVRSARSLAIRERRMISLTNGSPSLPIPCAASWIGIVLSGELGAFIGDKQVGQPLVCGSMVGEMAFFAGGVRNADVRGITKGFLATVMMTELTTLYQQVPRTTNKLVIWNVPLTRKTPHDA